MEHFVTLCNSQYLPQALALHMSMERHIQDYVLWILCMDDDAYLLLASLDLPNLRKIKVSDMETSELMKVKSQRTVAEYCWTVTPCAPRFVFDLDKSVDRVTYIDADLWFRKSPKAIFDEFEASGKHVLITDHSFAPEYDQSEKFGQYCVQFLTFTREEGEPIRKWWEDRCIEWCFARVEDDKFGDQKYLDDWPTRFREKVHVLQAKEFALAPWNAQRFPYGNAIFYHFHGLKLLSKNCLETGSYILPRVVWDNVYLPYSSDLRAAVEELGKIGFDCPPQTASTGMLQMFLRRLGNFKIKLSPLLKNNALRF
jgi:hypothetical protein